LRGSSHALIINRPKGRFLIIERRATGAVRDPAEKTKESDLTKQSAAAKVATFRKTEAGSAEEQPAEG
jgi:hypothetical protein